ncbi:MAG: substrate-binding domain-containing protein [Gemmataceae bacterium]
MLHTKRHSGLLTQPWLVAVLSLAVLAGLAVLLWSPWDRPAIASGQTLRLYCANGMRLPVAEIIRDYQDQYGVTVQPDYQGTGKLLSTMRTVHGAGDLFLAADRADMRKAQDLGYVAEVIPVARVTPVLVVHAQKQQALRQAGQPVTGLQDLLRDDLKVALANPDETAIGTLVRDQLTSRNLWPHLQKRLNDRTQAQVSTVGTVNDVARVIRTNPDHIGFVWDATAKQLPDLEIVPTPEFSQVHEIVQIGVLKKANNPTAALQFARYLASQNRGLELFRKYHFDTIPDADQWAEVPALTIFAGAMLKPAIEPILQQFQQREGARITTNYAGCGLLVAGMKSMKQGMEKGRFPDGYVSCDISFQEKVQQFFEAADILYKNDLVLIVPKGNPQSIQSLHDLTRADVLVGLPHPEKSAIGEMTDHLLRKLGLHDRVYAPDREKKVVHSSEAHTLVTQTRFGALDVAVVARSNALSAPQNVERYLDIMNIDLTDAVATQTFAIAKDSQHKYLMKRLLQAIVAPENVERVQAIGFEFVYQSE